MSRAEGARTNDDESRTTRTTLRRRDRPGSCNLSLMGDHAGRDPLEDRIVRATERLRAASEWMNEAEEQLALARERLVQARRALRASQTGEAPDEALHADRPEPSGEGP